ncbi:unknown [Feldmannia species virus]|uniref:Uncharacterized protein n=1 Tax=Feldmannia species virus TaxID=39420 RepID=B5LWD1_9PHYC|nr:hypothetical protein FeldSpV_gp042 [Feldmannia species virus]ACH46794.1 unknown [Feldmannia species virus]
MVLSKVEEVVAHIGFDDRDFLCSGSRPLACVRDITRLLENGKGGRLVEENLTASGLKKLSDARITLRLRQECAERSTPSLETEALARDELDLTNSSDIDTFIKVLHSWGNCVIHDSRYYLHMVFRFYLKEYHDTARKLGLVLEHPSYQFILDSIYPSTSASKFPPEFRRFLRDNPPRSPRVPLPLKRSATEVTYAENFEDRSEISTARASIQRIMHKWSSERRCVYPEYLRPGSSKSDFIVERVAYARKVDEVSSGMKKLSAVCTIKLDKVVSQCPISATAHEEYMKHVFVQSGEQLKERFGFFSRESYHEIFFAVKDHGIHEKLFSATSFDVGGYDNFKAFCTRKGRLSNDEASVRKLLMTVVDVVFLLGCYNRRRLARADAGSIIREAVSNAVNNR